MRSGISVQWLLPLALSTLASASRSMLAAAAAVAGAVAASAAHEWADAIALIQTRASVSQPFTPSVSMLDLGAAAMARGPAHPQTMINFGDAQYISYLRIGKQILAGMLDTGSFELIVFGNDCRTCGVAAHYNPSLSATFRAGRLVAQQSFGSGSCYSTASADILQIGPFSETRQSFWTVQKANMPTLADAAFEVIIGLGPPEAPSSDAWKAVTSVILNITSYYDVAQRAPEWLMKQVDKRLEIADEMSVKTTLLNNFEVSTFSICLGPVPRSNGVVVWNDAAFLGQPDLFTQVPVTGQHTWSANLTNPTLEVRDATSQNASGAANGSSDLGCTAGSPCSAILDSGMALIAAPRPVIDRLREAMSRLEPDCSNVDALPHLVFDLGGQRFSLPPDAYVAEIDGGMPDHLASLIRFDNTSTCQLLLLESIAVTERGPLWILGMPFFRKYYTTFNLGNTREERSFFIAEAGQDCSPASPGEEQQERRSLVRRVNLHKVHLPQTARIAMQEQFARL